MIRAAVCLMLALWLAACASAPASQPASCTLQKVADLPVRLVGGALLVPATLDHHDVQMEVDTGTSSSTVTPDIATALGLRADPHRQTTVHSTGGETMTRNTLVQTFEVGDQMWSDESFVTSPLARNFDLSPPVAGLLGTNYLADFDVELDLPHRRMTLWSVQGCSGDFAFRGETHWRMKLERYWPNLMVAKVQIDAKPVSALIDWGASSSILKESVAAQLGVTPSMLQADPAEHSHGVDRIEIVSHAHRFSEVRIGAGVFHNIRLAVGPIHAMNISMLLGLDFARTRRVWLSYTTEQLFVIPPSGARGVEGDTGSTVPPGN